MNDQPNWVKHWNRLIKNGFSVNSDYSPIEDCVVLLVRKPTDYEYYKLYPGNVDFVDKVNALITDHRIIGVEDVV